MEMTDYIDHSFCELRLEAATFDIALSVAVSSLPHYKHKIMSLSLSLQLVVVNGLGC